MKKKLYTAPTSIEIYIEGKDSICQTSKVIVDTDKKLGDDDNYDASSRRSSDWDAYER